MWSEEQRNGSHLGVNRENSKPTNTAAFSQLGNLYQYLIALECCLDLSEGQVVSIEQLGDITHADYQYEIKHHAQPDHQLIDTHIDFWKTLRNWVDNKGVLDQYANFVLLTSSCVREETLVGDWNRIDSDERYEKLSVLKDQILSSDKQYKTIKKHVERVFDFSGLYSESVLTELLGKIVIKHSYESASLLWERLKVHQGLLAIPIKDRSKILISLLGFIAHKGVTTTAKWDIEVSEFHDFLRERAAEIRSNEYIHYPDLGQIEIGTEYDDHRFVKEIHRIPYPEKVPLAAKDYYFASVTIGRMAEQNPHAISEFQSEVDQIGIELTAKKENICFAIAGKTDSNLVKNSKILFNDAILHLKASDKYLKAAKKEFHRGLIHTHVNGSDFKWKIEVSDIED